MGLTIWVLCNAFAFRVRFADREADPGLDDAFRRVEKFCCSPIAQRADDPNAVREQFVERKATCNVNDKICPTTGDGLENPKPGPLGGTAFKTTFQDSRDFGARKNFKFEMLNLPRPPA